MLLWKTLKAYYHTIELIRTQISASKTADLMEEMTEENAYLCHTLEQWKTVAEDWAQQTMIERARADDLQRRLDELDSYINKFT